MGWRLAHSAFENLNVRHVSFDFWNTMAFSNPLFKTERAEIISRNLDEPVSHSAIGSAFQKVGEVYNQHQENGKPCISPLNLLNLVFSELNPQSVQHQTLQAVYLEILDAFVKHPPVLCPEFVSALKTTLSLHKTISITSNTAFIPGDSIELFLKEMGLLSHFSFGLFSDKMGCAKPNKEVFEKLFSQVNSIHLGVSPPEILHIGDNVENDVNWANKYGLQSVLIQNFNNRS